jgi:hypothetical protein
MLASFAVLAHPLHIPSPYGGDELTYRVIPLLVFLGIQFVGGIALFADAGLRLLRERRK